MLSPLWQINESIGRHENMALGTRLRTHAEPDDLLVEETVGGEALHCSALQRPRALVHARGPRQSDDVRAVERRAAKVQQPRGRVREEARALAWVRRGSKEEETTEMVRTSFAWEDSSPTG